MRKIAHISDLHFGRIDPRIAEGLLQDLALCRPDLVVVSGDLTQRARSGQFRRAQSFLGRIAAPKLIIPGNHDVPLYNLARRFAYPLRAYQRHISADLNPVYRDEQIAVFGVNTTRRFPFVNGRISRDQIETVCNEILPLGGRIFKTVVTHHPFLALPQDERYGLVGRAKRALRRFAECGVDLILAGHFHRGYSGLSYPEDETGRRILIVQASTVSSRTRGEPNGYNMLAIRPPDLTLMHRVWDGIRFREGVRENWRRSHERWEKTVQSSEFRV